MKDYPFIKFSVLFISGILLAQILTPKPELFLLLLSLVILLFIANRKLKIKILNYTLRTASVLMIVFAGVLTANLQKEGRFYLSEDLYKQSNFHAWGKIRSIELPDDHEYSFILDSDSLMMDKAKVRFTPILLVNVKDESRRELIENYLSLIPGSKVEVRGVYIKGRERRNPGEFDYNSHLRRSGISGNLYLYDTDSLRILERGQNIAAPFHLLRIKIDKLLNESLTPEAYGLLKGLILADRSSIDYNTRDLFINSGVIHVLAVSGLHVGFIVLIFYFAFGRFNIYVRLTCTALGLLLFMFLTGIPSSVFRAVVMALVILTGQFTGRSSNVYNSLAVAAFILLVINPSDIYNPGFQLSFAAVLSISFLYPLFQNVIAKLNIPKYLRTLLLFAALSFSAQIGTLPFIIYYFSKISLTSIAANIFIVPLIGVILGAGILFLILSSVSLYLASLTALSINFLSMIVFNIVEAAGNPQYSFLYIRNFSILDSAAFYISAMLIILISIYSKNLIIKVFGAAIIILVYYQSTILDNKALITPGNLNVTMIDVGQGDAFLITFPNGKTALLDGGESLKDYCNGERVIIPLLNHLGINEINYAFISHFDNDHYSGVLPLIYEGMIDKVFIPAGDTSSKAHRFVSFLRKRNSDFEEVKTKVIKEGGAAVYISGKDNMPGKQYNTNENSMLIKVQYGNNSFLFTGDLDKKGESYYLYKSRDFLKADVLKVSHHGSKYSTTASFLNAVDPEISLISAGHQNKFGHPSHEVIDRLFKQGSRILRTDKLGAVILESDGEIIKEIKWR